MALSISIPTTQYDASGNQISATYWKIIAINANLAEQIFSLQVNGYASSESYNANPLQSPLMVERVFFPDVVNVPGAPWPFTPAYLAANYPDNPGAVLAAAEAYCMLYPFFNGATQVP
jgi:hypothetical protein